MVSARFGAVEHRITITNLSQHEILLPLVDSLRLNLKIRPDEQIENVYVEKGADIPSEQGTHRDAVGDGYHWIGRSTTYAHPIKDEPREIIPAEIVFRTNGHNVRTANEKYGLVRGNRIQRANSDHT